MNNLLELAVQRKLVTLIDYARCDGWIDTLSILKACDKGMDALTELLVADNGDPGLSYSVAGTIHDAWKSSPRLDTILAWFNLDLPYSDGIAHHCRDAVDLFIHEGGFQQLHRALLETPHYCGPRLLEVERFIDDIVSPNYARPLETVPSFASVRKWYTELLEPGFRFRELVGSAFSLDMVFALADVVMGFSKDWTSRLGGYADLEHESIITDSWRNWLVEQGHVKSDQSGVGNAVDELYEFSPFAW